MPPIGSYDEIIVSQLLKKDGEVALENVCHWGKTLSFEMTCTIPSIPFCLLFTDQDVSSVVSGAKLLLCHHGHQAPEIVSSVKHLLL